MCSAAQFRSSRPEIASFPSLPMSGSGSQTDPRPGGTVLSLGVSPWQRAAVSSPAGGTAPVYSSPIISGMPPLPEPVAALEHVSVPPPGVSMGAVGVRTVGGLGHVTGVTVPGVGGGVVPVTVASGPVPVIAGIVPPPAEALEREKDSRQSKRQRMIRAEEKEQEDDETLERLSRFLLCIGLFGLPLVHFVQVWYFSREMLDKNSNWFVRRNAFFALFCGTVEFLAVMSWFIVFQAMSERFDALNIIKSRLSLANLT